LATYFSLLKGFIAIGILYMPKNCRNGGWAFTLGTMIFSFFVTYYAIVKLLQARAKTPVGCSFAEIAEHAIGKKGKYVVDVFLTVMQYGFVISFTYFVLESMKSVVDEAFETDIDKLYIGLGAFIVTAPLCLVRKIELFAFTFLIADILILLTAIIIVYFAIVHLQDKDWEWGQGVEPLN
jgi:amino acid permease